MKLVVFGLLAAGAIVGCGSAEEEEVTDTSTETTMEDTSATGTDTAAATEE